MVEEEEAIDVKGSEEWGVVANETGELPVQWGLLITMVRLLSSHRPRLIQPNTLLPHPSHVVDGSRPDHGQTPIQIVIVQSDLAIRIP